MAETTGISWATATWNPWQGCHKVSEACTNCYMYRQKKQYGQDATKVVRSAKATFNKPLTSQEEGFAPGGRVFTCSWSDWFIEEADLWRTEAWEIIRQRKDLIFLVLTKRVDRILQCLPPDWGAGWSNVWLGFTAENQQRFDERWAHAKRIPAALWFISVGPALGLIDMSAALKPGIMPIDDLARRCGFFHGGANVNNGYGCDHPKQEEVEEGEGMCHTFSCPLAIELNPEEPEDAAILVQDGLSGTESDWMQPYPRIRLVITEGESGPSARPSHPDWYRSLRDQCKAAGIDYHHKQNGEWICVYDRDREDPDWQNTPKRKPNEQWLNLAGGQGYHGERVVLMRRVGIEKAGRLLDGQLWDQLPPISTP